MIWRTRLTVVGVIMLAVVAAILSFSGKGATAAPLQQIPPTSTSELPTNTPAPPTNTPIPTDTPIPNETPFATITPAGTVPPSGTSTPVPSTRVPRPGGGGGAPPGPSGTPTVNGCVKSIGKNGISLSTDPGFYQPHVQTIPRERLAQVLAGPRRVDTIWWWRLRTDAGVEGWGNQDEMTPDPGPCAFGANSAMGGTPPYPLTIMPAFSYQATPLGGSAPAPAAPPQAAPPQATPAQQEALPQTGNGLELWFLAGLLAVTVIVVGWVRRRLRTP